MSARLPLLRALGLVSRPLLALLLAACELPIAALGPDAGPPFDASGLTPADSADEAITRRWVLQPRCGSSDCHGAAQPSAGLDLVSPGVNARIRGATSVHEACLEETLVVPGVAQASFLMDKVLGQEGPCGDPMPLEGELPLEERRCLVEWIAAME